MASEITQRAEWDGSFSLLLDGEVILERRPLEEIEEKANTLSLALKLRQATPVPNSVDSPPPTV
jgi:hypothetical protein